MRDKVTPYLWSDSDLTEFANSAVNEVCERARLLQEVTDLAVIIGTGIYPLPYPLVQVIAGHFITADGQCTPLYPLNQAAFLHLQVSTYGATGRPTHFTRGTVANTIQFYPTPDVAGVATTTNTRLPSDQEAMVSLPDEPVIPAEFHRDLVYWILSEAYTVNDSDMGSAELQAKNEAKFEARFGRKITARGEMQGRKRIVGSSMNPVVFGA